MYQWSIELEGIFVLSLATRWVRHSYLSKEATIDPLYLWVIMACHTSLVIWSTCHRLNFLPNLATLVVAIATLFVAATLCLRLVVAKGMFGSRPSIATLCHTFLPSLPKVSSSK